MTSPVLKSEACLVSNFYGHFALPPYDKNNSRLMSHRDFLTEEEIDGLKKEGRILVTLQNRWIYDVTDFVNDHPGGEEVITDLANTDVTAVMSDAGIHEHSKAAYDMIEEYLIGQLSSHTAYNSYEELHRATDIDDDFQTYNFLDLNKPLLLQVLRANWTRDFYVSQVHKPRHYSKGSAPLFGNFLEPLSLTPWWIVPLIWVPTNMYVASIALQGLSWPVLGALYAFGLFLWTLVEYLLHRFLFHVDDHLPESQYAFLIHFLLHGVHHYLPMDKMRLVMPPAMFFVIATPLYFLCHFVFRHYYVSQAIFAGAHMGYVIYDCTHYFLHHKRLPAVFKGTKDYHLDHHYKNYELGFGVTSKFWDVVFGTTLVDTSKL